MGQVVNPTQVLRQQQQEHQTHRTHTHSPIEPGFLSENRNVHQTIFFGDNAEKNENSSKVDYCKRCQTAFMQSNSGGPKRPMNPQSMELHELTVACFFINDVASP
jgi:hypothetical protein